MELGDQKILTSALVEIGDMLSVSKDKLASVLDLSASGFAELRYCRKALRLPSKSL